MNPQARSLLRHGWEQEARGEGDAAIETYRQAVLADPRESATYAHLGNLLYTSGYTAEARGIVRIGLRHLPDSPLLHWVDCMTTLPRVPASAEERDRALAAFAAALPGLRAVCLGRAEALPEAVRAVGFMSPFLLPYHGPVDPALMAVHGRLAADIMGAAFPDHAHTRARADACAGPVSRTPHEPIRIGIVTGLFRRHSVWRLPTRGWVEHLDRSRFRLFGYHPRDEHDDQTAYAAGHFERFEHGLRPLPEWMRIIAEDRPHLLIYPQLGNDQPSSQLAALRLAPVQCTTWGHPVTTGLPTIDHFLSSAAMEPPDGDMHYTENLARLPGLGTVCDPSCAAWDEPLTVSDGWAALDLPRDSVRILCCQETPKYQPEHDDLYPRIAQALPNARFVFMDLGRRGRDTLWARLYQAFARHGLDALAHCRFMPGLPPAAFSALVRDAHVVLDPIGWSGCNTTLEAVGHHIPVVTMPGATMRSRHGLAILSIAGVTDTIVHSPDDYVAAAVRLGRDEAFRGQVAARLASGKARLYGDPAPVRWLEEFLEDAVDRACPVA
ncbi:MAG: hypothetical protein AB7F35_00095 [Acetobacteraceae bacterium]